MPDDPNSVPSGRLARWIALGALILFAVGLYFRDGRTVPPFGAAPAAAPDTLSTR